MEIVKCSKCGRSIFWATSPAGKAMPVDARAVTAYFVEEEPAMSGRNQVQLIDVRASLSEQAGMQAPKMYVSHFVTCPNADEFSRAASARGRV